MKIINSSHVRGLKRLAGYRLPYASLLTAIIAVVIIGGGVFAYQYVPTKNTVASPPIAAPIATPHSTPTPTSIDKVTTTPTQNNSAHQAYEDAQQKLALQKVLCVDPMGRINGTFLDTQQAAITQYSTASNAITYAPGTAQYRSSYNSAAFAFNFNVQMSYDMYISGINSLNSSANCGVTPGYKKYSYRDMLNSSGNYVPYIEGSYLSDY